MNFAYSKPTFLLSVLRAMFPMPTEVVLTSLLGGFVLVFVFRYLQRTRRYKGKLLPPGSMGWPYFGETLKMYTENPNSFFSARQKRYGDVFKSHILGCPCVMASSPEAVKLILVSQAHKFKPTFPKSKENLIGPEALFFHEGTYHSMLRKFVQASFRTSVLREMVPEIEKVVLALIPTWKNSTVVTLHEMKKYAFEVAIKSAFGEKHFRELVGIKQLYHTMEEGYNSMPINLPGFHYGKAVEARKELHETLIKVIEKRRRTSECGNGGILEKLMQSTDDKLSSLTDSQVADNIIGIIFAAHDTTASVMTWVLKYLHDHPEVLSLVTKEQEKIRRTLTIENRELTWDDTRCMVFTSKVIQETLRSASIISFTFREAVEDVEIDGYVIPKGWKVLPLFRIIHHSADFFPQPEKFDPSRFEVSPKPNTYFPFGSGARICPGSELAKLEILVLLHHLTTAYRWEAAGEEDGVQYGPFLVPKGGFPVRVTARRIPCHMTE